MVQSNFELKVISGQIWYGIDGQPLVPTAELGPSFEELSTLPAQPVESAEPTFWERVGELLTPDRPAGLPGAQQLFEQTTRSEREQALADAQWLHPVLSELQLRLCAVEVIYRAQERMGRLSRPVAEERTLLLGKMEAIFARLERTLTDYREVVRFASRDVYEALPGEDEASKDLQLDARVGTDRQRLEELTERLQRARDTYELTVQGRAGLGGRPKRELRDTIEV